jgi:predicted molibdopterin-dependent oxidoreductase YjgC
MSEVPSGQVSRRLPTHGVVERGEPVTIEMDGERLEAYAGETLAAVLLAYGRRGVRTSVRFRLPRGLFCGMGSCYECLVVVDGRPNIRACMTPVQPGMRAGTQRGPFEGVRPVPDWS